jgi:transcriptional regulator with XRE-family HTH domain
MGLGTLLKDARLAAGLTQEQLAAEAQMDRAYISEIERGKVSISIDRFLRICDALGIRAAEIIDRLQKLPPRRR